MLARSGRWADDAGGGGVNADVELSWREGVGRGK